jgi:hypothetical protein
MKAKIQRRRRVREAFIVTGSVLVILGVAVFMTSPPTGVSRMRVVFYVNDSATKQPIVSATLSIDGRISGVGQVPYANMPTDSNGSVSIAAPFSIFSVDVIKKGYQEYYEQNLPMANIYVIHLGLTNAMSSLEAINSTRRGGSALPLPLGQLVGAIVAAAGVVVLAMAAVWRFQRDYP